MKVHRFYLSSLLISIIFLGKNYSQEQKPCGDWLTFEDEKCFKLVDNTFVVHSQAESVCRQLSADSVSVRIRSVAEQQLIVHYLKSLNVLDNVWIGVKRVNTSFKYFDKTDITFTNWAPNRPLDRPGYDCAIMSADETNLGQWLDEKCQKKHLVLCQRNQTWSLDRMQRIFMETRKELSDKLEQHHAQLNELQSQMSQIQVFKQNPVPIGFIYIQLPYQAKPESLWPGVTWIEVSKQYAGLFFRVLGGNSSDFEVLQNESSPRLISVKSSMLNGQPGVWSDQVQRGLWSNYVFTGAFAGSDVGTSFLVSDDEVRPTNHAIKIWKRIK